MPVTVTSAASATGTSPIAVYVRYLVNGHHYFSDVVSATATIGSARNTATVILVPISESSPARTTAKIATYCPAPRQHKGSITGRLGVMTIEGSCSQPPWTCRQAAQRNDAAGK